MEKVLRYSGRISFGLLLFLTVAMAVATVFEKAYGSEMTHVLFYSSPWFMASWVMLALYSLLYLFAQKVYKHFTTFCLHIALLLILLGALITRFTAQNGSIHLRQGKPTHFFSDEDRGINHIPFTLELNRFEIEYYPGTQSPADYISHVTVSDPLNDKEFDTRVSMNNILKYKGYRFYQASFDDDKQGTVLRTNRDVYGIPVTYAGYYFLFITMLVMLVNPKGRFRTLLRSPLLKKSTLTVLFAFSLLSVSANPGKNAEALSQKDAQTFSGLWMLYNGRLAPVHTFAHDFCVKITGKPAYNKYNETQVLSGFLFYGEQWNQQPVFTVESHELQQILGSEKASVADFFVYHKNVQHYKLLPYLTDAHRPGQQSAFLKEIAKLDEKVQIITMLQNGYLLNIFPVEVDKQINWLSPNDSLLKYTQIADFIPLAKSFLQSQENNRFLNLVNTIKEAQHTTAQTILPSTTKLKAEIFYNNSNLFSWLFKFALTFGMVGLILFIYNIFRAKKIPADTILSLLLLLLFVVHTFGLGLRTYISGRLPLGNGFETMLFTAWCAMLVALLLRRYSTLIPTLGLLLSGFTLLVAHLGNMNPKITHLVPVLSSPLLSIHVSVIMFSYALAGFMALNSIISFILMAFGSKQKMDLLNPVIKKLRLLSEIFLYPCVFFLAAGIFIGAIWANVSWGRYWGWDPKEVWALVTLLLAALPLHKKSLPVLNRTFAFNIHILIIFISILMTYFGVNYFLGGMHSYADASGSNTVLIIISGLIILLTALIVTAYFRIRLNNK